MADEIFVPSPAETGAFKEKTHETITVADVADLLHLSALRSNGKTEWHGPNPTGQGAKEDGFILYEEGNAWDRSIDRRYTGVEVAKMAGIDPDAYEPYKQHSANTRRNGDGFSGYQRKSSPAPSSKPKPAEEGAVNKAEKTFDTRTLKERGITLRTFKDFHIKEGPESWQYPTFTISGKFSRYREKFYDPMAAGKRWNKKQSPMKCRWMPGDSSKPPLCYNLHAIKGAEEVWLVNGEVSVWSMHQAGMVAVSPFGEGQKIEEIVQTCFDHGVEKIHIAFDNDATGHTASYRAAAKAELLEMEYIVYDLQGKEGCDISDYYEQSDFDDEEFVYALEVIPRASRPKVLDWGKQGNAEEDEVDVEPKEKAKKEDDDKKDNKPSKSETMCSILDTIGAKAFRTKDERFYMSLPDNEGIHFIHDMNSEKLAVNLHWIYNQHTGKHIEDAPLSLALKTIKGYVEHNKIFDEVWIRSAWHEGHVYIDLAREDNLVVKIGPDCADSWELTNSPPVHFRRPRGVFELPIPIHGGSIEPLRPLINAVYDDDWMLMVSWLVNSLFPPTAPFPVLAINGEQGSAKSTTSKILRNLIDPNFTELISSSIKEERDLAIAARNCYVIGFDNISNLQSWQSDAFCRLATGQGFRTRKNYSDEDESMFNARRPMIVNGIESIIGREDLQNRSLVCSLPPIPDHKRAEESKIYEAVEALHPGILGWIFDAISHILKNIDYVDLDRTPRMADFAKRIVAGEEIMPWPNGKFMDVLMENRSQVIEISLENSPVASEIIGFMTGKKFWEGTISDLHHDILAHASWESKNSKAWPSTRNGFSSAVKRSAPGLRQTGLDIQHNNTSRARLIKIIRT